MSFMRSPYYVWHDGQNIHLPDMMSFKEFDALVVMRIAELVTKEKPTLKRAIKNAVTDHRGNFGCDALCKLQEKKGAIDILKTFAKHLKKEKSK